MTVIVVWGYIVILHLLCRLSISPRSLWWERRWWDEHLLVPCGKNMQVWSMTSRQCFNVLFRHDIIISKVALQLCVQYFFLCRILQAGLWYNIWCVVFSLTASQAAAQARGRSGQQSAAASSITGMSVQEAQQILNISTLTPEEIQKVQTHSLSVPWWGVS